MPAKAKPSSVPEQVEDSDEAESIITVPKFKKLNKMAPDILMSTGGFLFVSKDVLPLSEQLEICSSVEPEVGVSDAFRSLRITRDLTRSPTAMRRKYCAIHTIAFKFDGYTAQYCRWLTQHTTTVGKSTVEPFMHSTTADEEKLEALPINVAVYAVESCTRFNYYSEIDDKSRLKLSPPVRDYYQVYHADAPPIG
eukprot:IDg13269t1